MKFLEYCKTLEDKIKKAYEETVTVMDAERLAGEFLHAQMITANELAKVDLDARMRKTGVKAIKADVYMQAVSSSEKKPTEATLTAMIDTNENVGEEQKDLDKAEVNRDMIKNYLNIFVEAHIYYRGIAKQGMSN